MRDNHKSRTRLDSWKSIASYLRRDVRTVIRWEKEKNLPVHRVPGGTRQAVFAYIEEIDDWLAGSPNSDGEQLLNKVEPVGNEYRPTSTRIDHTHQNTGMERDSSLASARRNEGLSRMWSRRAVLKLILAGTASFLISTTLLLSLRSAHLVSAFAPLTDDGLE